MKKILNRYKYQLILFFTVAFLFFVNYKPGTFLAGWDNLQTELNPGLAVKRAFFSVWQEYQSFGLTAGMAHAADLVRSSFLWLFSFFIPQNMIRYFFHFLMLLIGGLGSFKLFKVILGTNEVRTPESLLDSGPALPAGRRASLARMTIEIPSFLGALFYILNLGTVQIFYLPFESFSAFFAFLPWGIWSFMKMLDHNHEKKYNKRLLIFFLLNFLGTPSFYTQQLFVVYLLILGCVALGKLITPIQQIDKDSKRASLARITFLFTLILLINSFWILPQIYFLKTNGDWVTQAKSNQLATEKTIFQNLDKGSPDYFLKLEGFYFDLSGINNWQLFLPWHIHFSGVLKLLPNFFAFLMVVGLATGIREKKTRFIFIFIVCSLALLSATPPLSWLNTLLRKNPIINQIFRSPFSKFIVPYSLAYSFFVALGIKSLVEFAHSGEKQIIRKFSYLLFCVLIVMYSLPSFQGFFISPEMKVKIPDDYFKIINYFKDTDKNKRIALFPDYTFWGWFFHKWGYNGSGFLWYGIEQPIISRTFDVWSDVSESYFWEQKQAVEAEDLAKLESIFEKYNIDYLIIDYSLIPVVSNYKSLQYDRINNLIAKSQKISPVFQANNLALFKIEHPQKIEKFISLSSALPNIGPVKKLMADDIAYWENRHYQSDIKKPFGVFYPFLDLTSLTRVSKKNWQIDEGQNSISVNTHIENAKDYKNIFINPIYSASLLNQDKLEEIKLNLSITQNADTLKLDFEKKLIKTFDLSSLDYKNDIGFSIPDLPQKYGYLVKIKAKNSRGSPLSFYITDDTKKQPVIEEKLNTGTQYLILPPKFQYGVGYTFIFQKPLYKNFISENKIEELSVYLFPYENIKTLKLIGNNYLNTQPNFLEDFLVNKINYFMYKVSVDREKSKNKKLIFSQSYDPGWIAFSNGKVLNHVKINNWENGWNLDKVTVNSNQNTNIVVIFWPQYLQFIGFAILIGSFIWILKYKSNRNNNK